MSKLNELIRTLCPNVEYIELGDMYYTYSGLHRKTRKDFDNGICKFISYENILQNPEVNQNCNNYVKLNKDEKQNFIELNDMLVTSVSKNKTDIGVVAAVCTKPIENICINSFCIGMGIKENYRNIINPYYCKYLMRSEKVTSQIKKCFFKSGRQGYILVQEKFLRINNPIPPLYIQNKIVSLLDKNGGVNNE